MTEPVSEPGAEATERARLKAREVLRICVREATQAHRESAIAALIGNALLAERIAERERCAKVAEGFGDRTNSDAWTITRTMAGVDIAAAIRLAAPTPKEGRRDAR